MERKEAEKLAGRLVHRYWNRTSLGEGEPKQLHQEALRRAFEQIPHPRAALSPYLDEDRMADALVVTDGVLFRVTVHLPDVETASLPSITVWSIPLRPDQHRVQLRIATSESGRTVRTWAFHVGEREAIGLRCDVSEADGRAPADDLAEALARELGWDAGDQRRSPGFAAG